MAEYLKAAGERFARWFDGLSARQQQVLSKIVVACFQCGFAVLAIYLWCSINLGPLGEVIKRYCQHLSCPSL